MNVNEYFYVHGDVLCEDRIKISEFDITKIKHTSKFYINKFKVQLENIQLNGKIAFLYAGGPSSHSSERNPSTNKFRNMSLNTDVVEPQFAVQETLGFMAHQYLKVLSKKNNIDYVSINSNTCASSMFSLYEAYDLIHNKNYDNVIIITEERTRPDTIRLFYELNIDLKLGEGFALMVLSKNNTGVLIDNCKWEYSFNVNPFKTTEEGYKKIYSKADYIKIHGTNTSTNDKAEAWLYSLNKNIISYKHEIGHTQGASALIEICKVLDDNTITGSICCMASGLGNMYGSIVLYK